MIGVEDHEKLIKKELGLRLNALQSNGFFGVLGLAFWISHPWPLLTLLAVLFASLEKTVLGLSVAPLPLGEPPLVRLCVRCEAAFVSVQSLLFFLHQLLFLILSANYKQLWQLSPTLSFRAMFTLICVSYDCKHNAFQYYSFLTHNLNSGRVRSARFLECGILRSEVFAVSWR